jgi:hypothetical protein
LNNLVTGKGGISPEMAIRLSKAFGSTPDFWLRLQMNYDLARARLRERKMRVKAYNALPSPDPAALPSVYLENAFRHLRGAILRGDLQFVELPSCPHPP